MDTLNAAGRVHIGDRTDPVATIDLIEGETHACP